MDRRRFLSLLALGVPSSIVAEKVGLLEKLRTYFFAPRGGWRKQGELWLGADHGSVQLECVGLHLEHLRAQIPVLMENDLLLFEQWGDMGRGTLTVHDGQSWNPRGRVTVKHVDPVHKVVTFAS